MTWNHNLRDLNEILDELEVMQLKLEKSESLRSRTVAKNSLKIGENEKRIKALEVKTLRLAGLVTCMYLYMKSESGFRKRKFEAILQMVASAPKMRGAKVKSSELKVK